MNRNVFFLLTILSIASPAIIGCGGRPSGDLSQSTDEQAVADYEAMVEKQASGGDKE
jgi:hypothetical protein